MLSPFPPTRDTVIHNTLDCKLSSCNHIRQSIQLLNFLKHNLPQLIFSVNVKRSRLYSTVGLVIERFDIKKQLGMLRDSGQKRQICVPVSYTHLDVYKRQEQGHTVR